jgi:hypothetical protein
VNWSKARITTWKTGTGFSLPNTSFGADIAAAPDAGIVRTGMFPEMAVKQMM